MYTAERMRKALDPAAGSFGGAQQGPRFPAPRVLELALLHYSRSGEPQSLAAVTRPFSALLRGGIQDRQRSGFPRLSLDRAALRPTFESTLAATV